MIQSVKLTWTSQTLALIPGFVVGKLEPQRHEFRPEITAISISLEHVTPNTLNYVQAIVNLSNLSHVVACLAIATGVKTQ